MKTKTITILLFLLIFLPAFATFAQKTDFSGEWKINKEKTVIPSDQLFLSKITLQLRNDSLLTTRVYENGYGEEYPFEENLTMDNKECKIVIFEMPRTSTATYSDTVGGIKISSTTTFNGNNGQEDMVAKETWKFDKEGQTLSLEFVNTMSGTEITGTYYYTRAN